MWEPRYSIPETANKLDKTEEHVWNLLEQGNLGAIVLAELTINADGPQAEKLYDWCLLSPKAVRAYRTGLKEVIEWSATGGLVTAMASCRDINKIAVLTMNPESSSFEGAIHIGPLLQTIPPHLQDLWKDEALEMANDIWMAEWDKSQRNMPKGQIASAIASRFRSTHKRKLTKRGKPITAAYILRHVLQKWTPPQAE